ncbi:MAG: hypothetical protein FJ290_31110 [Planctomycetes bacterium]|nr:hypothetical protein [Planctomycetota bacterium]
MLGLLISSAAAFGFGGEEGPAAGHKVTLFYTSDIRGRLVPAACEEGELGGVARMATLFRQWAKDHPDAILVDAGNATVGDHPQAAEAINRSTLAALGKMGYAVVNCADNEAALGPQALAALAKGQTFAFVSANLVRNDGAPAGFRPHAVVKRGDTRVAFIGLATGPRIIEPGEALAAALRDLGGQADLIVVLAHLEPEQMHALAKKHQRVNAFLGGRAATSAPCDIVGNTLIAYLGDNGCTVGRLEAQFPPGGRPAARWRVALLGPEVAAAEEMEPLVAEFRKAIGDARPPGADWDPKMPCTSSFVGADVCRLCHIKEFFAWQKTQHAGAYVTLLQKGKRDDPQCLACHATGMDMPGGFDPARQKAPPPRAKQAPLDPLKGVGCESCHGGSRRHLGIALKDRVAAKAAPQLRSGEAVRNCQRCHAPNRPCPDQKDAAPFDIKERLEKIKHWADRELRPADF